MSVAIAEPAATPSGLERKYTLTQAAELLGFPSAHALRMYLKRRPDLVTPTYRRAGRSLIMLLTTADVLLIETAISGTPVKS